MSRVTSLVFALLCAAGSARADEVLFANGDRLTGRLVRLVGGKLALESEMLGAIEIDPAKIQTLSTAEPVEVHVKDGTVIADALVAAGAGGFRTRGEGRVPATPIALTDVESINPPPDAWHGNLVAGAAFHRGNSFTDEAHTRLDAVRETKVNRLTAIASYDGDRSRDLDTDVRTTTERRLFGALKYDHFITDRLYWLLSNSAEKDGVKELELRFVTGPGLGYTWIKTDRTTFFTEAGLSYVNENYEDSELDDEYIAALVSWGLTRKLADALDFFHSGSWLPSLEDIDDRMLVRTETGLRAKLTTRTFLEGKVRWDWDSEPADDRERVDVDYILALGLGF